MGTVGTKRADTSRCPRCARARLVEIRVNLRDRAVTMHSCSACDLRWWDDEAGRPVPLEDVLDRAGSPRSA